MRSKPTARGFVRFLSTDVGSRVLSAARGEMTVEEVFKLPPDELEMVRTLLIFWGRASEHVDDR